MLKSITLQVIGDHRLVCEGCEERIEAMLKKLEGVNKVRAKARSQRIEVLYDTSMLDPGAIAQRITEAGYQTNVER